MVDVATWKKLYGLFNPTLRVELTDQDLYVRRPGSVALAVADDLRLGLEPEGKWVVCGSMGSGKSSELVHLGTLLQETHAVIGLDLPRSVASIDLVQPSEVLFLIGAAAIRTARDLFDQDIDKKLVQRLTNSFQGILGAGHTVDLGKLIQGVALFAANLAAPGVGSVASAATGTAHMASGALGDRAKMALGGPVLGGLTRPVKEGEPDFEQLRAAVDDILEALRKKRPPVVLVDGLDKVRELDAIRKLFATTRILALPRAQVVYSGPITLMLAAEWQATGGVFQRERLTNLVVHPPEPEWVKLSDEALEANRAAMAKVVHRRLGRLGLTEETVFEGSGLARLIRESGGLLRDLIHLVNRSIRHALRHQATRLDRATIEAAIVEIRKEYEVTFNTQRVDELRHVRKHNEPSGAERSNDLLLDGYVFPYSNSRVWFEPHPILRGLRPGL